MNNLPFTLVPQEQVRKDFDENGAVWPLRVMTDEQAAAHLKRIVGMDKQIDLMNSDYRCKSQVLFPWVADIATSEAVRHYVEAVLGPNFHCWDTLFWIKKPGDESFVSFHQDATYWNFTPKDAVTVWLSFNDTTVDKGPIQYVQGSHKRRQLQHDDVKAEGNLLMRGQTVRQDFDNERFVSAEIPAGHITVHSPYIIHGSGHNKSTEARVAFGMIFAASHVKPIATYSPESTLWVQGKDEFNHFIHDPYPKSDFDRNINNWRLAYDRQHANYYKMKQENGDA